MEKAKLLVRTAKSGKIIAELEFPDGKKITARHLRLDDVALDGVDVEVERERGQPTLIKTDDRVLFSAHTPEPTSSTTTRPQLGPSATSGREPRRPHERSSEPPKGKRDLQNQHVGHVRNPARAPYNFVPLNETVVETNPSVPKLDQYHDGKYTGWIDIEVEAITPLYIRGALTESEVAEGMESKDKPDFCAPVGRIRIPGSSLRGLTRNMVEIVSFGKFTFFDRHRRLYYRGLADQSSLRQEYQRRMSSFDRQAKKPRYHFSAGVLRRNERSQEGEAFEILSSGSNFRQIPKSEAREIVRKTKEVYAEFTQHKLDDGFLVVSGDIPKKKHDWLIDYPTEHAEIIPIPEEDVRSYSEDRTRGDGVSDLLDEARKYKEVPCFFVQWQDEEGNDRVSFGHTGFFRLAYEKTVGQHVPASLKDKNKIDFAEAIFGNEKKHAGRVFFEDAFLVEEQGDPQQDAQTPKILSEPKSTTFQHYLVQDSDETRSLNHYNSGTAIRGYKQYWHKSGEHWAETDKDTVARHSTQYLEKGIRPVKPGTRFRGKIRFENLSDKELGALLFALDLPQRCGHKLGMGKPLGLGSVRITPTLHLSDRRQRYTDLFAEWDGEAVHSSDVSTHKQTFQKYALQKLGQDEGEMLWETDRLRELLVMLRLDVGKMLENGSATRYMTIEPQNEYKSRNVLPRPTDLLSPTSVAQVVADLRDQEHVVGPEITHITEVKITGLWDTFDVTWPLDPKVNVLAGGNGSGKTTILELMKHALTPSADGDQKENEYQRKVRYVPQEFQITFDNNETTHYRGRKLVDRPSSHLEVAFISTFDSMVEDEQGGKLSAYYERGLTKKLDDSIKDLHVARSLLPPEVTKPLINGLVDILNYVFRRTQKRIQFVGAFILDDPVLNKLKQDEHIPPEVCEKLQHMKQVTYLRDRDFLDALGEAIGKGATRTYGSKILRRTRVIAGNGECMFGKSGLSDLEKDKNSPVPVEILRNLTEVAQNDPYFPDSHFMDVLEDTIGGNNATKYRSWILKHIRLIPDSPPSHVVFALGDGQRLTPDQLSAGEKQILIILFTALIRRLESRRTGKRHCVLIMDEPEISLHLEWQKNLIDYIQQLNENMQIIIATHSPGIVKKGWLDRAVLLDGIRSGRTS